MIDKLKSIRTIDELINAKMLEVEQLWTLATKVNTCTEGERVQTSISQDKLGDVVSKIVDLQKEINEDIDRYVDLKKECMSYIDSISDPLIVGILYKRYFQYKTFEQIAEELDISSRWVQKIHKKYISSL